MRPRAGRLLTTLALLGSAATGCDDTTFGDIGATLSAEIANPDTTIFEDATATFRAVAEYEGIGPGEPRTIQWGTNDTIRLRLVVSTIDRTVRVTGRDTGQAYVFAIINGDFRDSVLITIVRSGTLRWEKALAGPATLHPAVDDSGNVRVLDGTGTLWAFTPIGDTLFNTASCGSTFGPAVRALAAVATGPGCTRQHDDLGVVQWSAAVGDSSSAPALAADDATIVVSQEADVGAGIEAVLVTRLSPTGGVVWQDTLDSGPTELPTGSAPAIATNGDIYVTWRSAADSFHLSRFTGTGTRRWTVDLPAWARNTTPAIGSGRVVVGFEGGVAAYDSAGGPALWTATFTAGATVSSPIIDGSGNVYVQTTDGLYSFAPAGTERWAADSLGASMEATTTGAGAPTLLLAGLLLVGCEGSVCAVDAASGALVWRTAVTRVVGSPVVDRDGQIYALNLDGKLIAIFGNQPAAFNGWPTEGGNHQRSRRRQ